MCVCGTCIQAHAHVEDAGQPWLVFLRHHTLSLFGGFGSRISHCGLGTRPRRLDWLASEFQGAACPHLLRLGLQTHTVNCGIDVAGLGVIWGSNSGPCAWKASAVELSPNPKAAVFVSLGQIHRFRLTIQHSIASAHQMTPRSQSQQMSPSTFLPTSHWPHVLLMA